MTCLSNRDRQYVNREGKADTYCVGCVLLHFVCLHPMQGRRFGGLERANPECGDNDQAKPWSLSQLPEISNNERCAFHQDRMGQQSPRPVSSPFFSGRSTQSHDWCASCGFTSKPLFTEYICQQVSRVVKTIWLGLCCSTSKFAQKSWVSFAGEKNDALYPTDWSAAVNLSADFFTTWGRATSLSISDAPEVWSLKYFQNCYQRKPYRKSTGHYWSLPAKYS